MHEDTFMITIEAGLTLVYIKQEVDLSPEEFILATNFEFGFGNLKYICKNGKLVVT